VPNPVGYEPNALQKHTKSEVTARGYSFLIYPKTTLEINE
jgi:hypothetical protein